MVGVLGPGAATFAGGGSQPTTVSFDQPGSYSLRLEAVGGDASDEVTISVEPVPEFSQWVADFSLAEPGALDDSDGDEWSNLMEFASATDPGGRFEPRPPGARSGPRHPARVSLHLPPPASTRPGHASGSRGDGYSLYGLSYTVEASTDSRFLAAAAEILMHQQEGAPTDNGDGSETVTVRLIPPVGTTACGSSASASRPVRGAGSSPGARSALVGLPCLAGFPTEHFELRAQR